MGVNKHLSLHTSILVSEQRNIYLVQTPRLLLLQDLTLPHLADLVAGPSVHTMGASSTIFLPQAWDAEPAGLPFLPGLCGRIGPDATTVIPHHCGKVAVGLAQHLTVARVVAGVLQRRQNLDLLHASASPKHTEVFK